jgi:hypothetical protein
MRAGGRTGIVVAAAGSFVSVVALVLALVYGVANPDQDRGYEGPRVASNGACVLSGQHKAPLWDGVTASASHWMEAPGQATPGVDLGRLVGDAAPAVELVQADVGEPMFRGRPDDFVHVERIARERLEVETARFGQPVQVSGARPVAARAAASVDVFGAGVLVKYQHAGRPPLYVFNDGTAVDGAARMKLGDDELAALMRAFAQVGFDRLQTADPVEAWGLPAVTLACARLQLVPLQAPGLAPLVDVLEDLHQRLDARVVTHVFARRERDVRVEAWPAQANVPTLDDLASGYATIAHVPDALRARLAAAPVSYFSAAGGVFRVTSAPFVVERCSEAAEATCRVWPAASGVDLDAALADEGAAVALPARRVVDALAASGTFFQGTVAYHVDRATAEVDVPVERPERDERPAPSPRDTDAMRPVLARAATLPAGPALVLLSAACAGLEACAGECAASFRRFGSGAERAGDAFLSCPRLHRARVDELLPRSVDERVAASIAAFLARLPGPPPEAAAVLDLLASTAPRAR